MTTPMSAGAVFDFERLARLEVGKVLPTVQSCHGPTGHPVKQREMKLFDMEMQNIEVARELGYPIEHQQVIGERVASMGVEAQECCLLPN